MLDLVIAMIVARLIAPASKLATARILDPATAASSLGDVLGLGAVDEDELYAVLYDETDHEGAATMRVSIVAKAERSEAAIRKQTTGRTDDGLPVHSFQTLLADLATYSRIQATTALCNPRRQVPERLIAYLDDLAKTKRPKHEINQRR